MNNKTNQLKHELGVGHKNNICEENQPYEKFLRFGASSLTESELLAIIIRTGTKNLSALQIAEQVLQKASYPREGLLGLHDISLDELQKINGIGEVKAVKLKCLTELSMRMSRATAKLGFSARNSKTVADYFMEQLRHQEKECVLLLSLDTKGLIIKESMLSCGSVRMSVLSPREVFLEALKQKAVSIILIHNHPSGDPTPSNNDKAITKIIMNLGQQLDIPLLDHIIIGDNRYTSFKEVSLL